MPRIRITARIPSAPAVSAAGAVSGPYISTCKFGVPSAENILYVFSLYGLSEGDEVSWEAALGEGDEILGPTDRHALIVQYLSGGGGVVTATVNGASIGSINYSEVGCE